MVDGDNFVRVDCDFGAEGLWTQSWASLSPAQLGLSPPLCLALEAWQAHYEELGWQLGSPDPHFDYDRHDRVGRKIADFVRNERADLHVVYGGDEPFPGEMPSA